MAEKQAHAVELVEEAISIFEYNVKLYPASANVYDSLGEAQEKISKFGDARENYKKAWELGKESKDPNTGIYEKNFQRMSEKKKGSAGS